MHHQPAFPTTARFFGLLAFLVVLTTTIQVQAQQTAVRVQWQGATLEGAPLVLNDAQLILLGRDGRLSLIPREQVTSLKKLVEPYRPDSAVELRDQLIAEYGRGYDVTGTTHYLVVHPRGQRDRWAKRFEALYRQFVGYFAARQIGLAQPKFPLVAVVFDNRELFVANARREGHQVTDVVYGYYSPTTNRIYLYDVGEGRADKQLWRVTASTIIHEAAHQSAYNTGVHSRFHASPRWLVEGLGTLFEARGVWNSQAYPTPNERINRSRLRHFQAYRQRRPTGSLAELVTSDRMFADHPLDAYAESWALTYYLTETQPSAYAAYLKRVAARPSFRDYTAEQRLSDFTAAFGASLPLVESHFLRFLDEVK